MKFIIYITVYRDRKKEDVIITAALVCVRLERLMAQVQYDTPVVEINCFALESCALFDDDYLCDILTTSGYRSLILLGCFAL